MDPNVTPLERAFQLAASGTCANVEQIRKKLKAEGFSTAQIEGRSLTRQLASLISKSVGNSSDV